MQRAGERAPEQETVRRVKRKSAAGVWLDDRLRKIPEELIDIVKIAKSPGADIRSIEDALSNPIAARQLELPVGIAPIVGSPEYSCCAR